MDGFEGRVVKAAFRQTAVQGHLTAFKTRADGSAGTSLLALVAFTARLPMSGAFTAAEPLAAMFRTGVRFQIVQSHSSGRGGTKVLTPSALPRILKISSLAGALSERLKWPSRRSPGCLSRGISRGRRGCRPPR